MSKADVVAALSRLMSAGPAPSDVWWPGFNSDDPSTWKSRQETMKKFEVAIKAAREEEEEEKVKIRGMKMDKIIVDEFAEESVEEDRAIADYVIAIGAAISKSNQVFMLNGPAQLTVKKADGNFAKKPHIGGESFRPTGAYIGKRRKMIYTFSPLEAAPYAIVEMEEAQATKLFVGFKEWASSLVDRDMRMLRDDAMKEASRKAEREKLAEKNEQYSEIGWGEW